MKEEKNKKIIQIVVVLVLLVLAFYLGDKHGASQIASLSGGGTRAAYAGNRGGAGRSMGGGFVSGTILSKDQNSITVQLGGAGADQVNGSSTGSKIIFYSDQTSVMKSVSGTPNDLSVGQNVTVMGTANSDGSVTANSIQVRNPNPQGN
jgi:hypothetical protein